MEKELLEIVNENDEVIGLEDRGKIHTDGLLHREIHIWFYTPKGEIIFQHRAKDKDTYPDLLDATVGGHTEPGMDYEQTALKEMEEETGIVGDIKNLHFLKKIKSRLFDEVTHKKNYAFKTQYSYLFDGEISDLRVEDGKAIGFEAWPIDTIINLSEEEKKRFMPVVYSKEFLDLFKKIKDNI